MTKLVNLYYNARGLYPSERDEIIKKIDLIRKFDDELDYDYSLVNSDENYVTVDYNVDLNKAFKLFEMFYNITFKYVRKDFRYVPVITLELSDNREFNYKGECVYR